MWIRNQNNHLHFPVAEAGLRPTHFQADTFPSSFRERITVQHDGIDTNWLHQNPMRRWSWKTVRNGPAMMRCALKISDQDWKRVHYLGRVPYDRFLSMMQVSRVHIYLTYPFVLSWSLLEAMSAGAAIVASDTPPVKEAMVDCETGLFVDFFDQVGLVEKTCQLLDDEALREKLGTAARQHIVDHYDLKRTCLPKHLEWVDQLAKQPVLGPDQFMS